MLYAIAVYFRNLPGEHLADPKMMQWGMLVNLKVAQSQSQGYCSWMAGESQVYLVGGPNDCAVMHFGQPVSSRWSR